jgi:hypothetical protein
MDKTVYNDIHSQSIEVNWQPSPLSQSSDSHLCRCDAVSVTHAFNRVDWDSCAPLSLKFDRDFFTSRLDHYTCIKCPLLFHADLFVIAVARFPRSRPGEWLDLLRRAPLHLAITSSLDSLGTEGTLLDLRLTV